MFRRWLDILTFGISAKRRDLDAKIAEADKALRGIAAIPPSYVTVSPIGDSNLSYLRYLCSVADDQRWQWFMYELREKMIRQTIDGTRSMTGDRDLYLGAVLGLDLLSAEMRRARVALEELTTNGSIEQA